MPLPGPISKISRLFKSIILIIFNNIYFIYFTCLDPCPRKKNPAREAPGRPPRKEILPGPLAGPGRPAGQEIFIWAKFPARPGRKFWRNFLPIFVGRGSLSPDWDNVLRDPLYVRERWRWCLWGHGHRRLPPVRTVVRPP